MSLKNKILSMLIFMSIVPLAIVGIYYDVNTQRLIEEKTITYSETATSDLGKLLNTRLETLARSLNSNIANRTLQEILSSRYSKTGTWTVAEELQAKNVFDTVVFLNPEVRSVVLYLYDGKIEVYGTKDVYLKNSTLQTSMISITRTLIDSAPSPLPSSFETLGYQPLWLNSFIEKNAKSVLVKEIKVNNYTKPVGLLLYYIDPQFILENTTEPENNPHNKMYLTNDKGIFLLHEDNHKIGTLMEPKVLTTIQNQIESKMCATGSFTEKDRIFSYTQLKNGWLLVNEIPRAPLFYNFTLYRNTTLFIALFCVFAALYISMRFSENISKRVNGLLVNMEQVEQGNMNIDFSESFRSKDQISMLYQQFNRMVQRLNRLIQSQYIQKLKLQEAELKALQFQINPHFLYNILEVIQMTAIKKGAHDIGNIALRLGQMMRYNLTSIGLEQVSLENEINHVKNYVFLYQLCSDKSIELFFETDPALNQIQVPRFILQPLVENAIVHGFDHRSHTGVIEIHCFQRSNQYILQVIDDGLGISPQRLLELTTLLDAKTKALDHSNTIGILNVSTRIYLLFGDPYGLKLESTQGSGTTCTITLPAHQEVNYV